LQRRVLSHQPTKRPFEFGRQDKLSHRSIPLFQGHSKLADDGFRRVGLQLASAKTNRGPTSLDGRFLSPFFDPPFAQQFREAILFVIRKIRGGTQNLVKGHSIHEVILSDRAN
jgi:hypothetical protein